MFVYHWEALFHEKQGSANVIKDYFEYLKYFTDVDKIISEDCNYVDFDEIDTLLDLYTTEEIENILFDVNYLVTEETC